MSATDDADDAETIEYTLRVTRDDWNAWRQTVPRGTSLRERLTRLLNADARYGGSLIETADGEYGDDLEFRPSEGLRQAIIEHDTDRIALLQIRKAAMRASQEIGDDPDAAREEITTILNVLDDAI